MINAIATDPFHKNTKKVIYREKTYSLKYWWFIWIFIYFSSTFRHPIFAERRYIKFEEKIINKGGKDRRRGIRPRPS
jgi:hypothetical protein